MPRTSKSRTAERPAAAAASLTRPRRAMALAAGKTATAPNSPTTVTRIANITSRMLTPAARRERRRIQSSKFKVRKLERLQLWKTEN